ncbi:MAG: transcriptional regulator [Saprospiraceae bacterium]|nr:transcriptional regulator [Saprospiraceae bacterium]MCB9326853.1 transcriptional regulator [Lewinellaceae bacterium]
MELAAAKEKFIQSWGALGSNWGINRTMAQIHALLLIAPESLSADDIMEQLQISRGNANMNIRALIDWGLVYKELVVGQRKEFFIAEKDIWDVVRKITAQRKKKELDPIIKTLEQLSQVEEKSAEADAFKKVIHDINAVSAKAEKALDALTNSDDHWLANFLLKMMG